MKIKGMVVNGEVVNYAFPERPREMEACFGCLYLVKGGWFTDDGMEKPWRRFLENLSKFSSIRRVLS